MEKQLQNEIRVQQIINQRLSQKLGNVLGQIATLETQLDFAVQEIERLNKELDELKPKEKAKKKGE